MKKMFNECPLTVKKLDPDPIKQFLRWYRDAERCAAIMHPEAACLSTLKENGDPSAKTMLIERPDNKGPVFHTNIASDAGRRLTANPTASLTFYWDLLWRQVRMSGTTAQISSADADACFSKKPRETQLRAWLSGSVETLRDRKELEEKLKEIKQKFDSNPIPRPHSWVGFRLAPERFEFWQGRRYRLHDRFLYTKTGNGLWKITRLYP